MIEYVDMRTVENVISTKTNTVQPAVSGGTTMRGSIVEDCVVVEECSIAAHVGSRTIGAAVYPVGRPAFPPPDSNNNNDHHRNLEATDHLNHHTDHHSWNKCKSFDSLYYCTLTHLSLF